jgi:hypothetical protein
MIKSAQVSNLNSNVFSPVPLVQVLRVLYAHHATPRNQVFQKSTFQAPNVSPLALKVFMMRTSFASHVHLSARLAPTLRLAHLAKLMQTVNSNS